MLNNSLQTKSGGHSLQVAKTEFLRYAEVQFDAADANHDGHLDVEELRFFLNLLAHPKMGNH